MKGIFESVISEWFSNSPDVWMTKKNRELFRITKTLVGENWKDYPLLSMGKPGVTLRDMESGKGKFPENFDSYQIVQPGDLIFCLFDMNETPRTVGYSDLHGMITGAYTVVKTLPEVSPKFLYYLYLMIDEHKGLQPFYTGLRNSIRPDNFMGIEVKVPPYNIQEGIVEKLDVKTELIDETIKLEKQRIIELEGLKFSVVEEFISGDHYK
jgi:type I restriction enzyme, S subunit